MEEMEKARCKNCGTEIDEGSYCGECWAILEENIRTRIRPIPE